MLEDREGLSVATSVDGDNVGVTEGVTNVGLNVGISEG